MTSHIYPSALLGLLDESLDWTAEEVKAVLLTGNFVYDPSQVYVDELPAEHIIAVSEEGLANRTYVNGLAYGDPAVFLQLSSPLSISQVVLFQDTGDPAYSKLLMHYDVDSVIGAPKIPRGEDEFVYPIFPFGGFFQLTDEELFGPISTTLIGGPLAISELEGGVLLILPSVLLDSELNIHTHVLCIPSDEPEDCCEPTIRSSRCD